MLKLLKNFKRKEWLFLSFSIVFIVVQVWLDMTLPTYMKEISGVLQNPNGNVADIWKNGGMMLLCALGSGVSSVVVGYFGAYIAASFSQTLRERVYDKVEGFSMGEINKFSTASLITRSTNDITQIQFFIAMGLQVIIKAPITAIWALTYILGESWQFGLATGIAIALLAILFVTLIIVIMPKFKKMQKLTDNLNSVTRENLTGVRVVRAYNAEDYQENKFEKANTELNSNMLFAQRGMAFLGPIMTLLMNGLTLTIYWLGAYIIDSNVGNLALQGETFASMMVFMSYAMQMIMSFMMLAMIFIMLPRASVSSKRIFEVLNTNSSIVDGNFVAENQENKSMHKIQFENVSFRYPGGEGDVLKNINLDINEGETVAFIGSTGSGKSSLINLIPRFFDATEGKVFVDGVNVKDYSLNSLHNKIGYVPQTAVLFSGTINSNINYGEAKENILDEDMQKAIEISQSSEFVNNLENKAESPVAQGGKNLSGGQKQRLSIARAIARKPEIFIFDDSFSALDYKTDKALRKALKENTKNATTLIVAQRIGTILEADKIVVLESGKIVGMGTHKQLLENCPVYQEIAYSQLSKEELA